jgi:hypothetical protein
MGGKCMRKGHVICMMRRLSEKKESLDVGKERKVIKLKAYYVETQIKKEKRKVTVDRRKKRNESKKDIRGRETDEKGQSRADTHSLIMTNIYKVCFSISSRNTPSELRSFPT